MTTIYTIKTHLSKDKTHYHYPSTSMMTQEQQG